MTVSLQNVSLESLKFRDRDFMSTVACISEIHLNSEANAEASETRITSDGQQEAVCVQVYDKTTLLPTWFITSASRFLMSLWSQSSLLQHSMKFIGPMWSQFDPNESKIEDKAGYALGLSCDWQVTTTAFSQVKGIAICLLLTFTLIQKWLILTPENQDGDPKVRPRKNGRL